MTWPSSTVDTSEINESIFFNQFNCRYLEQNMRVMIKCLLRFPVRMSTLFFPYSFYA